MQILINKTKINLLQMGKALQREYPGALKTIDLKMTFSIACIGSEKKIKEIMSVHT